MKFEKNAPVDRIAHVFVIHVYIVDHVRYCIMNNQALRFLIHFSDSSFMKDISAYLFLEPNDSRT